VIFVGERVKVLQKGKITIPADIRQKLGISEGDYVEIEIIDNRLVVSPPNTIPNPTEYLLGLAKGTPSTEPLKQQLRKATAARAEKKLLRSADEVC
jgi:AbrB family looped-hinge helix DNA binding protein